MPLLWPIGAIPPAGPGTSCQVEEAQRDLAPVEHLTEQGRLGFSVRSSGGRRDWNMGKKNKRAHPQREPDTNPTVLMADASAEARDEWQGANGHVTSDNGADGSAHKAHQDKMSRKEYERLLEPLQVELVKLQAWTKQAGVRAVVIFEGRDAAGKGGCIKAITERVSPRVFRVVALPAPTERERSQLYVQRYIERLPAAGEIVLFDRSWYNRAGVEHVMGFVSEEDYSWFLTATPAVERVIIRAGIVLLKYWLEVEREEQTKRFEERITDGRKTWKLSPMDLESHRRWYDYSRARDAMFAATDTEQCPWYVIDANDQRRARLNCIAHLLSKIPYKSIHGKSIHLPKRQDPEGYVEPDWRRHPVPEVY
jgi:polyphosphate kinase 2